ncbi:DUF2974 domain-containing protein [Bacillus hominis]|uniref:Mbeg1-like protein n=1 Tax=Bacillus hominis TaxID=2817478 RepID=UPI0025A13477|nr:Mbeg1-like protein [Bacillus hominis]MDM5434404.1 DUF2974 domain-containing protein [Bacillus hominis]
MATDFELRVLAEVAYINELNLEYNWESKPLSTFPKTCKKIYKNVSTSMHQQLDTVLQDWYIVEIYRRSETTVNVGLDAYLFKNRDDFYVFSYRGTNFKSTQFIYDLKENFTFSFSTQINTNKGQFWRAFKFTLACIEKYKINPKMITLTGHSKGGALASRIGFLYSLGEQKVLKARTFAPASTELHYVHFLDQPKPTIDSINFTLERDRVINILTKVRFFSFLCLFTPYKLFKSENKHALGKKSLFVLWLMWTTHPYIGNKHIIKPLQKSLLRHSLILFDDHFDNNGML